MMTLHRHLKKIAKATLVGAAFAALATSANADTTLRGASMFDEQHAFTKTLMKFDELVGQYYSGDVTFDLRLNGELGVEKDYVTFLNQGVAIDYTILAPSNMARFAPSIPLMDMPFLFRDLDHWNAVLSSNVLAPLEKELSEKADIVIVGYAGGGTRNLISSEKISNMQELAGHKMRVMGAPIQAQVFNAIGAAPSAISYNEVYNAIQTGVVNGLENEAASIQNLKFYEVAPYLTKTAHSITVRPIVFSGKSYRKLPKDLQAAIMKAGKEAGNYGRELESREDAIKLKQMADAGQIMVSDFANREKLLEMVKPVQDNYAASLNATDLLTAIRNK
ncbi:TRAP transporter substrate-binding protein [Marinomonas pollencensis]|uniref:Tripartite ATP-independent transporter DctP family solute receptor n=1 Tax=Marinomonas pollencensis TaxID=491954 RepID=A0A3E0DN42_9GAMM|nr:TRAP transporter substrate-binding protein [Marinomonas pollencensis]REG84133.1 tripartite ATP-independent transporter DctP family solute receptor [Marinomonas pollencensis]